MKILVNKIQSQAFQSSFFKGATGLLMFISIYLLVRLLGNSNYGILVLIIGFFQWGLYFDFGISNVLKSKIPELIYKNKITLINQYIRESLILTIFLSLILFFIFYSIISFLDLNQLLNMQSNDEYVKKLFTLNCVFFCLNFVLSINKSFYIGVLNPKFSEISAALSQFIFCLAIILILLSNYSNQLENKLLIISWINGLCITIVNLIFFVLFFKKYPYKLICFNKIDKEISKKIISQGFKFMIIQIFMVIIFFSDPYLISSYCSAEDAGSYDIVTKLFQLPLLIITSGLATYWPFFSKKFHEKDKTWFITTFKKFEKNFVVIILLILLFCLISKWIIKFWVGDYYFESISYFTLLLVALGIIGRIYYTFYANFFNGINKLKSQIFLLGIVALLKIPLTILLLKNGGGINSLFFLLAFFMFLFGIILKYESKKIIQLLND